MKKYQEWNSGISRSISSLVDVSSFLLIESTGDSEFDSNFCSSTSDDPIMDDSLNSSRRRFLEDDDAQSCSYEECGHVVDDDDEDMDDLNIKIENDDHNGDDDDDDVVVDSSRCFRGFNRKHVGWNRNIMEEEDDDEEAGVVEQGWMNGGVNNKCKNNYVNSVVVDNEFKSQKDKDKLFWETCLAS